MNPQGERVAPAAVVAGEAAAAAAGGARERGILFSAPMVLALLSGVKTQTRRAWREQPIDVIAATRSSRVVNGQRGWVAKFSDEPPGGKMVRCRFGEVGDRLWVREAWAFDHTVKDSIKLLGRRDLSGRDLLTATKYRADGEADVPRWRPGIHMPRWASRITLEVTDVRVQRLQDITEADAWAEGIGAIDAHDSDGDTAGAIETFAALWDSINGERAPWASNPWVWAVTFRRLAP